MMGLQAVYRGISDRGHIRSQPKFCPNVASVLFRRRYVMAGQCH